MKVGRGAGRLAAGTFELVKSGISATRGGLGRSRVPMECWGESAGGSRANTTIALSRNYPPPCADADASRIERARVEGARVEGAHGREVAPEAAPPATLHAPSGRFDGDAEWSAEVDFRSLSDRDLLAHVAGVAPPSAWPAPEWTVRAVDWLRREPQEFAVELGLCAADARRLVASLEFARRVLERPRTELPSIRCARDAFEQCALAFAGLEQEQFRVLALDAKHRVKQNLVVSVGSLTTSIVHPREVFRLAVRTASAAIVCVHNHPSGDPEPSAEDIEVTRRLAAVGRTLGITLLDHIVAGDNCFVSLRERISW